MSESVCTSYLIQQGFGVAAKSTTECKNMDPMGVVCFHQADVGEYIREEEAFSKL